MIEPQKLQSLYEEGKFDEALTLLDKALPGLGTDAEEDLERHGAAYVEALQQFAIGLLIIGEINNAVEQSEQAVFVARKLSEDFPSNINKSVLVDAQLAYSKTLFEAGRGPISMGIVEDAIHIVTGLAKEEPHRYIPKLAGALSNMAILMTQSGEAQKALPYAQKAVSYYQKLSATKPDFLAPFAGELSNLAILQLEMNKTDDALVSVKQSIGVLEEISNKTDTPIADLAMAYGTQGQILMQLENFTDAMASFKTGADKINALEEDAQERFVGLMSSLLNDYVDAAQSLEIPDADIQSALSPYGIDIAEDLEGLEFDIDEATLSDEGTSDAPEGEATLH